jgi:hypothetical protein
VYTGEAARLAFAEVREAAHVARGSPRSRMKSPIATKPAPAAQRRARGLTQLAIAPPASMPSAEVRTSAEAAATNTVTRAVGASAA